MNPQLEGVEAIEGTYIFDVARSVKAYRLNKFFWMHRDPAFRDLVINQPQTAFDQMQLSAEERALVEQHDWLGLIKYGVSFFVLEKFARVVRVSNLQVYASMRGETLEAFLKTRLVPASA
jgi:gallate dioxygenase